MRNILVTFWLFAAAIFSPLSAHADTATEAVEAFYTAATTEGMCEQAQLIRPDYTFQQCSNLKEVKIHRLKVVKEDEHEAIVYLNMNYQTDKPRRFKGHLHLYREGDRWIIIGKDYKSSKAMSRNRYIKNYMGTAKKPNEEEEKEVEEQDTLAGNHREVIKRLEKKHPKFAKNNPIVLIDTSDQEMYFYVKRQLKKIYPISSGLKGEGSLIGSEQTPLGIHIIREKFGKDAPSGAIFEAREETGDIAEIIREPRSVQEDHVTSRILWLDGLEMGKNRGENVDSYKRFIYIHGTHEEGLIGQKASHGCIRMYNKDVIELFDKLPKNSLVYIGR